MFTSETTEAQDREGTHYTVTVSRTAYAIGRFAVSATIDFGKGVFPLGDVEHLNALPAARERAARRLLIYSQTPDCFYLR